ncbi:MAG: hybrid sensor histidine kinase/response regulator, partial [Phototrophicaceae bacterium]
PDVANIPVIFISARSQQNDIVKGFELGGLDYITKPIQYYEVLARVKTHIELYQHKQAVEEKLHIIQSMRQQEEEHFAKISDMRNQFIQAATHDLKNPLYTIMGYADLLNDMRDSLTSDQLVQFSEHITLSSHKMNILISDMLDLLRVESKFVNLDLRMVNFNEFVLQQLAGHQLKAEQEAIELHFRSDVDQISVAIDPNLFSRVLDNLVSNAIKYSPSNTHVYITIMNTDTAVLLDIEDHGYGMSQDTIDNLFVPFFRAADIQKKEIEGTGLGMAVVKEIIDRHDGEISVQSVLGEGSLFRIMLPHKHVSELM